MKSTIEQRKKDHLKFALNDVSQTGNSGFDAYRFIHNAVPEIDFDEIDTTTQFLGKKVNFPFFISSMTGGAEKGELLNRNLAKAAQKMGVAMGVGSQRAAIVKPELRKTFGVVRKYAPDVPVLANVGLVQLNYGFGLNEIKEIVKMVSADAVIFHTNPIQEVIQPEGDRNFKNLLPKLSKIVEKIDVPVIVKEVGFGLSEDVVRRLYKSGVRIFDTAGWGGTSWAVVEGLRGKADEELGNLFGQWGIPTTDSINMCASFKKSLSIKKQKEVVILASGGIRTGIDIAKSIAMGADLVGLAKPFGEAALKSEMEVENLIVRLGMGLKMAMFGTGAKNISVLKKVKLQKL